MVEIRHFKMSFGDKTVIKDLSFDVLAAKLFWEVMARVNYDAAHCLTISADPGDLLDKRQTIFGGKSDSPSDIFPEERGLYKKEKSLDVMLYLVNFERFGVKEARIFL